MHSQGEVATYKHIIRELKSTTEEMQAHTELLGSRQADLIKDIEFKAEHIKSQDQLIIKFKKRLDRAEAERTRAEENCRAYIDRLETTSAEFSKLASTTERLRSEYIATKSRLEEAKASYDRVSQDLRVKTKTVAHLEKRLQSG
jgi:chromosome segregation ATPase